MHDPMVVAFEIKRPWPKTVRPTHIDGTPAKVFRYWPAIVTVWHREPGGHDSGEVCKHYRKTLRPDGTGKVTILHGWKLHMHHWKVQVHALQALRRRLLTRCTWCHGRHTRRDPVNMSHSWDGPRARWWQGERGLYHHDCSSVASAHATCVCENPVLDSYGAEHGPYGLCARCGKRRAFGTTPERLVRERALATVPVGARPVPKGETC